MKGPAYYTFAGNSLSKQTKQPSTVSYNEDSNDPKGALPDPVSSAIHLFD
jgi:hypothetical protein